MNKTPRIVIQRGFPSLRGHSDLVAKFAVCAVEWDHLQDLLTAAHISAPLGRLYSARLGAGLLWSTRAGYYLG